MNCLEFRRRLGSEPASVLEAFVAHRQECPHCAAAQGRADDFEERIRRAVGVSVPVNFADRILLAQTTEMRHGVRKRRRGFALMAFAAAASIVVAFVAIQRTGHEMPELAGLVVEHLHEHVVSAIDAESPVAKQDVMDAFASRGVKLTSVPDGVNYVHKCPAGPYKTLHMVMPESSGPVSVVYVVDKPSAQRVDFDHEGMRGREVPLGNGSLVMIAKADADFDAIERGWKTAMAAGVARDDHAVSELSALHGPPSDPVAYGRVIAAP